MNDKTTITVPCLNVPENLGWDLMRLPQDEYESKRLDLVRRCYEQYEIPYDVPEAWSDGPLTQWAWLVLVVNDLERDPETHHALTHWGIDFGFSSETVRRWIWAIS